MPNRVVFYRFISDQSKWGSTPNWCFCHAANWKCLYVVKGFCLFSCQLIPMRMKMEKYIESDTTIETVIERTAVLRLITYTVKSCRRRVSAVNLSDLFIKNRFFVKKTVS